MVGDSFEMWGGPWVNVTHASPAHTTQHDLAHGHRGSTQPSPTHKSYHYCECRNLASATRTCAQDGQWMVNSETNAPWTNYTLCKPRTHLVEHSAISEVSCERTQSYRKR